MVYSRNASTRAYIKAVALCALALTTLPSTMADTCAVSDSDKSYGIRVVDDVGCASGGLGCYNDHCRYCKVLENPKSTQFESCSSFGAIFPGMPALTLTTGPCEVSAGDATAGIAAVADTDCLYGGLGCFGDHCRFCKVKETPESTAFMSCSGLNVSTLVTKPTTTTSVTIATTPTPTVVGTAPCTLQVSDGDASAGINIVSDASCSSGGVGINIVTDTSCANGGAGCIDNVCRFCKVTETTQSAAFVDCTLIGAQPTSTTVAPTSTEAPTPVDTPAATLSSLAPGEECTQVVSDGDAAVGIDIITDTSCVNGGAGCIDNVCRFCKVTETAQSATFIDCPSV
ncbi:hypothetical protein BBO99_00008057 [Phytophthora kernoviae]|uniref:Uncharacterized protein n=1 Tax=Phytophthora kernoviae TaxID=325452 RepID=A0A3R7IF46_9STRA|nr:hypothetical protein JM16_007851 [Phytophthora kernoviae]RLN02682.1 hypothetical protein BBI17_007974 [Phytophthora kernoviae]RLN75804.1 hypothetical protein BBO99_00008057 [Phytophthora kernoviae]